MGTSETIERLARVGFVVKGVLYMVIGGLALQVAARAGGRVTGSSGALMTVLRQPLGHTMLLLAGLGLLGYAAWRILQGISDADGWGRGWRGFGMRASFVLRGVVHGALGLQALRLYGGLSTSSSEGKVAREALEWPFGEWLLVLAGLGLLAFAGQQVYAALACRFERNLDVRGMRREAGEWAVAVSRFGLAARAVVLALVGWRVVNAGWSRDPSEVGTTATSLRTLAEQPGELGVWLLGVTAAGLLAYGFYEMIHARYLHIRRAL